jgi:xanthine dehydrogenase iron-sulfur cluster and FAD-binding subunit A
LGNERHYAQEKASAVLHLKEFTQNAVGRDHDWNRLGDIWNHYCTLNEDGEVVDRGRFRTNTASVAKRFWDIGRALVAMETDTHSIWVSQQIKDLGHEVIVGNVPELRAISHGDRKSDKVTRRRLPAMHNLIRRSSGPSHIERWLNKRRLL